MINLLLFLLALAMVGFILVLKAIFAKDENETQVLNQKIGKLQSQLSAALDSADRVTKELLATEQKFEKLQHQKISADVKLGQRYENILPFMEKFPYKDDEIRGLFNPVDLIVFREDEVVFIEIKTGESQLSEKQRRIRDNIKAGRVKFETHRMNEKGVSIK
jgi:predicted Holliday junction resolvase-like endonuclease